MEYEITVHSTDTDEHTTSVILDLNEDQLKLLENIARMSLKNRKYSWSPYMAVYKAD